MTAQSHSNQIGQTYQRPWGTYKTLALGEGFQAKLITVNPGGRLSLQKHFHRAEHWVVVAGEPTVTVNGVSQVYKVDEHIHIPVTAEHRLENFTEEPAAIIEVQVGNYLGEDDIVRLDDTYNR